MTTLTRNEHRLRMLEIITEREGNEMAAAHENEKTMVELENHFDTHYEIFDNDVDDFEIVDYINGQLSKHQLAIEDLSKEYRVTDLFELYNLTGYVTKINDSWIVSIDFPWLGGE